MGKRDRRRGMAVMVTALLMGVVLPGDECCIRHMAETFADEFAILGYGEDRLLALFHQPFYTAASRALHVLGEPAIRAIIRESVAFWGTCRTVVQDKKGRGQCRE